MRATLLRFYSLLSGQIGFDPLKPLRTLRGLPGYFRDMRQFRAGYTGEFVISPALQNRSEEGGTTKSEYFWQDLLVARKIFEARPTRHIDIGSRIDGFVAHVAAFREIEVFDIRPISTNIPGIKFTRADLMDPVGELSECCDSLSCLHALEHFGLGRYGDPVDPLGFERGLASMARLLKSKGVFYLSVPIGIERVEFNSHRVIDPRKLVELASRSELHLSALTIIHPGGGVSERVSPDVALYDLARLTYVLGVFTFVKS
ncbi:MAG: DUF268 domain-containing protein [Deltaproteobacteria bacterium]|nr:DUF268 domain-containing protein [Deltaproteobacteria bacterium]